MRVCLAYRLVNELRDREMSRSYYGSHDGQKDAIYVQNTDNKVGIDRSRNAVR